MALVQLENYLAKRQQELEKISSEIDVLGKARVPIRVLEHASGIILYSEDYHLAEDFKISKRREHLGGISGYDGGYSTDRYETFPQFSFNLKNKSRIIPVYIQHSGFDKDERIVIKSVTRTDGCKDYSDKSGSHENYIDLDKVFSFFREKGVKESLLDKLHERVKIAEEF